MSIFGPPVKYHLWCSQNFYAFLVNSGIALLINKKFKDPNRSCQILYTLDMEYPIQVLVLFIIFFSPHFFFYFMANNNGLHFFFKYERLALWNYYLIENEYIVTLVNTMDGHRRCKELTEVYWSDETSYYVLVLHHHQPQVRK